MTDAASVIEEQLQNNTLCQWKAFKRLSYLRKYLYGTKPSVEIDHTPSCLLIHSGITLNRGDISHKEGSDAERIHRERHMLAEMIGGISIADLFVGGYNSNLGAILLQGVDARARLAPVQPFLWDQYDLPPNGIKVKP